MDEKSCWINLNRSTDERLQQLRAELLAITHRRDELLANIAALKKETTEKAQTRHRAGRTTSNNTKRSESTT